MADNTDWEAITNFFNSVIEEATVDNPNFTENRLVVTVYAEALGHTLAVTIPTRKVEDFMKNLPLFEAKMLR